MSKNLKNRLMFMLVAVVLLLVLFNVIAFAVPFEGKFNALYWVSYGFSYVVIIPLIFTLFIAANADEFNNDKCANLISLASLGIAAVGIFLAILFMALNIEDIWIPIVIMAVFFVFSMLGIFYVFINNKNEKE